MARRRRAEKRKLTPDVRYNDVVITQFINNMMSRGKRSLAEGLFYTALDRVKDRTGQEGVEVFRNALRNAQPALEVKSRRIGGATYQVPIEIKPQRRMQLAMRWLISFSRSRPDKSFADKLASELIAAGKNEGPTIKKREDTHRMAEANRAFAHCRW
ncbi:MAG TPA: 30S ribosomal protein S7 [Candidatus Krumholzibacteria bacterium]|nr:30S ribosomal protein S7 [Candidatus Krumholzibacteria bacterium]